MDPENAERLGIGYHNYCRNPKEDKEIGAWCYIEQKTKDDLHIDYCSCIDEGGPVTTQKPTTGGPTVGVKIFYTNFFTAKKKFFFTNFFTPKKIFFHHFLHDFFSIFYIVFLHHFISFFTSIFEK